MKALAKQSDQHMFSSFRLPSTPPKGGGRLLLSQSQLENGRSTLSFPRICPSPTPQISQEHQITYNGNSAQVVWPVNEVARQNNEKLQRSGQACEYCRARKVKCNGIKPLCDRCTARNGPCEWSDPPSQTRKRKTKGDGSKSGSSSSASSNAATPSPRVMPKTPPSVFKDEAQLSPEMLATLPKPKGSRKPKQKELSSLAVRPHWVTTSAPTPPQPSLRAPALEATNVVQAPRHRRTASLAPRQPRPDVTSSYLRLPTNEHGAGYTRFESLGHHMPATPGSMFNMTTPASTPRTLHYEVQHEAELAYPPEPWASSPLPQPQYHAPFMGMGYNPATSLSAPAHITGFSLQPSHTHQRVESSPHSVEADLYSSPESLPTQNPSEGLYDLAALPSPVFDHSVQYEGPGPAPVTFQVADPHALADTPESMLRYINDPDANIAQPHFGWASYTPVNGYTNQEIQGPLPRTSPTANRPEWMDTEFVPSYVSVAH